MNPEPVAQVTVCSVCGLAWEGHGENPTLADCVRLLKEELVRSTTAFLPGVWPSPIVPPIYPNISPPVYWNTCSACAHSGVCNCLNPPGAPIITNQVQMQLFDPLNSLHSYSSLDDLSVGIS